MKLDFTNKVVLVTGASAGIGESIALLFAELGAKLAIVGRNTENLHNVAARCEQQRGLKPLAIVADLSTDAGTEKTAADTIEHFGKLDVLVNNAAMGARSFIHNADMEVFDCVFSTNLRSVYHLTRLLVPELIKTKGNIVNISAVVGTSVVVGSLPYGMSKAALNHFSRIIALELAPKGVRVNILSPGITESTFMQRATGVSDAQYQAWLGEAGQGIPLGRVCRGRDIAHSAAYLASEYCALVTGAQLMVDGGLQFTNPSHLVQRHAKGGD